VTLSFRGDNQGEWNPDDPEYDHKDPEDDGQTGRRRRLHALGGAPQTQIRAEAQGKEDAQELRSPERVRWPPKGPNPLREIATACALDDKGTTGFNEGPGLG
jgi:hypothetical protein